MSQARKKMHTGNGTDFLSASKGVDIMSWLLQLCACGKCAISGKYQWRNVSVFCSTCAAMGEQARDPGFGFAKAEGDVRDE